MGSTSTIGFSATTSSAGRSQFSEVASGSIDGTTEGSLRFPSPNGQILDRPNLKVFSFGDMKSAARGFKSDTLLGEGGFGKVYKGWLDEKTLAPAKASSGMMVAIKKLNSESTQGNPNIEPLSWNTRIKIAIGAARDFGLAKLGPSGGQSHVTTRVMGTYGYAAPEYIATGHLYVKSDVYGFGVVLLEIMTAMRALDTKRPSGQQNLVEWVKPFLSNKKKLKGIMDARIEGQYSPKAAIQAAQLSLKCLENDPKQRPSMKEVLESLEAIEAIQVKSKESKNNISHQAPVVQAARHHRAVKV
ncbi:hypothetical protein TSUD_192390 [Trifolium subterraneum]|uniref:Protein kinase domain-containing protein n=1 Tax=Trifolium subterraneum TaxID=3900 RepID=A0A2Z6PDX8_TRISU|nr:hypothetical protein TSUD_192390 [Trifolium subterraneum]